MNIPLTLAIGDYVHTRELATGRERAEGIDLTVLNYPFEQVGLRFGALREWEVSEFSLANYCALVSRAQPAPMVALPVFPSRVFRQSAIFIREDSDIREATQLSGRRIGIPQWSQTATVYVRGYLTHDVGIPLSSIEWVQAGLNEPGRKEPLQLRLPDGIRLTQIADRTLTDMLLRGEIDAIITARPPEPFLKGGAGIRRLFPDFEQEEESYFRRTGIFPIMHVMVVRRDAYEKNRWIMRNLFEAFESAKQAALPRLRDITTAFIPGAWGPAHFERVSKLIFPDGDPWPYGIECNRVTLEAFLLYCFEQGVTVRHLKPEELFASELNFQVRV
jgi:4,5-dihydroxyphthalate decarboxylase